ncbi:DUF3137 domain-containing protein, partial [Aliikangiella maris]
IRRLGFFSGATTYQRYGFISLEPLITSKIIPQHDEKYTQQEDIFLTQLGDINVSIVECSLAKLRYVNNKQQVSKVFSGLIVELVSPTRINQQVILHARWSKLMNWLQQTPMPLNQKVDISVPGCEEKYAIYATNQTLAKQVFSQEVLQQLAEFDNQLDVAQPEISLFHNRLLILLHRPENFLGAPSLSQNTNKNQVLNSFLQQVEMMNQLIKIGEQILKNVQSEKSIMHDCGNLNSK